LDIVREIQPRLEAMTDWKAEPIEKVIEAYCQEKQLGLGKVAQPIRVAVSGGTISPPIFQSLEFLGKQHTMARIDRCAAMVG
jgi:glutamyl/glutaminyl-tRNA synthetase